MQAMTVMAFAVPPGRIGCRVEIAPDWLDAHAGLAPAFYTAAFDLGIDALKQVLGIDEGYRLREQRSTVALEAHLRILGPVPAGSTVELTARIVDRDAKRVHVAQEMRLGDSLVALRESMTISFDLVARRSCAFGPGVAARIDALHAEQLQLPPWHGEAHLLGVGRVPDDA
jgi:acyl-CoA thioesterase FadM